MSEYDLVLCDNLLNNLSLNYVEVTMKMIDQLTITNNNSFIFSVNPVEKIVERMKVPRMIDTKVDGTLVTETRKDCKNNILMLRYFSVH